MSRSLEPTPSESSTPRLDEKVADVPVSHLADARTHAVWISTNGRYLYATNERPSNATQGTFSKVDLRSGDILWEQVVGDRPSEVLVDDEVAYVSVRNEHTIKVFDVGGPQPQLISQAAANFQPDTLSLTNDKRTLIVGLRQNPAGRPARMAFIDVTDVAHPATTYLELPPGTITGHQWLSSNGGVTYIALEGRAATATVPGIPGHVAVVDNRIGALMTTYPYPNGLSGRTGCSSNSRDSPISTPASNVGATQVGHTEHRVLSECVLALARSPMAPAWQAIPGNLSMPSSTGSCAGVERTAASYAQRWQQRARQEYHTRISNATGHTRAEHAHRLPRASCGNCARDG